MADNQVLESLVLTLQKQVEAQAATILQLQKQVEKNTELINAAIAAITSIGNIQGVTVEIGKEPAPPASPREHKRPPASEIINNPVVVVDKTTGIAAIGTPKIGKTTD